MVHSRPTLPAGHGELTVRPAFDGWPELVAANRTDAATWDFNVGGLDVGDLRALARRETSAAAAAFSVKLQVPVRAPGDSAGPIIATGHQPQLYHPGVWVKDFLLERLAVEIGATALDIVVDSDGFDAVAVTSPCLGEGVQRCRQYLAVGTKDGCYASAPVPTAEQVAGFCAAADETLATLPAPSLRRHFASFCTCLAGATVASENLAELVTIARRRYEASVATGYLEVPLTQISQTEAFRRFVWHLATDADRFADAYNTELHQYRSLTKTRSSAQPVPDLREADGLVELPLWHIERGKRSTLRAAPAVGGGARLVADDGWVLDLPDRADTAQQVLASAAGIIAPKALALTLFTRLFVCDLFIHGVGGGRYDQVTDGIIRRYFGVEPPRFAVASLTMYLPLGAHVVSDEEIAVAKDRLNRLVHNPDALLDEIEFDSSEERERAVALAAEKTELVARIALPDADKKRLGIRIREVNAELSAVLAPLRAEYEADLTRLSGQASASEILTDRTYPFCFWDPAEIADKLP